MMFTDTQDIPSSRECSLGLKKYLAGLFSGLTVKVKTKKIYLTSSEFYPEFCLEWIDGPSHATMIRAVIRYLKDNNLDYYSDYPEMDRSLSLNSQIVFENMFKAQTGEDLQAHRAYNYSYDPGSNLIVETEEECGGLQLEYIWNYNTDLPVYC